jgi:hypothetical protein
LALLTKPSHAQGIDKIGSAQDVTKEYHKDHTSGDAVTFFGFLGLDSTLRAQ